MQDDGLHRPLPGSLDPVQEAPAAAAAVAGLRAGPLSKGALSWALFQGARDPYVILITIYIFGPYFANTVVGDPVRGQALVANIGLVYGLIAAFTAPLLGASIDTLGARKPLLAATVGLMAPLIALLWWARPDGSGLPVMTVAVILSAIGILFAWNEVLHNSLLTRAAGPKQAPHASGLGLSAGNGLSVLMLVFVLWAFALPGSVDWSFIPKTPLFGLDPAQHEPDRIVGPIVAAVMLLGSIPFFLFTADAEPTGVRLLDGLRRGVGGLVATVASLKGHKDVAIYLGSRMLYTDGMTALLLFGGVYAAGVMQWGVLEMLAFGILLSVFAVGGGFLAAWLDSTIGPKRAVQIEIAGALACLVAQLGMGREKVFFLWTFDPAAQAPLWNGPMFRTLPEVLYLIIGFGVAVFVTGSYASSRTLLTRLAPPERMASFFGLYSLSGTVTMWLGSLLVGVATAVVGTQQAGFIPIAGLLVLGLTGMFFVRGGAIPRP